jgi:Fic family protein
MDMKREIQGHYETVTILGEKVRAFVPPPLPPVPPIEWTPALRAKFDEALLALGRLDSTSGLIPDISLFLYMYIRKEAVLSSMIEGTQSSLSDLLLFEIEEEPGVPLDDVVEVSNYVAALNYGLKRIREGFPLSLRLFNEIHKKLLAGARGGNKDPGHFRRTQNWIGGSRPGNASFVPPPPQYMMECMGQLELFLHDQTERTPALLKAALAHVQFETIHPYLDGNGRLGRLLITLLLCDGKVLHEPALYLSLHFKNHRNYYYELLNKVRDTGDWESWLEFFAEAVTATANEAIETTNDLVEMTQNAQRKIGKLGRAAPSALKIYNLFLKAAIASSNFLVEKSGLTPATVNKSLVHLVQLGLLQEVTSKKRNRVFAYKTYIDKLNQGIDTTEC